MVAAAISQPMRRRQWWGLRIRQRCAKNLLSKAVYVSEQVCIRWCRTRACYTAKLTFCHDFPIKVWGAYCTSVHTIFESLQYWSRRSVCLSLTAFLHYCTYPDVTWGNGRGCPLVVHDWADLQSVHGFHCYDNIVLNAKCQ